MTFAAADLDASPKAAAGQFRTGVDPLNCYVTLVGMGYYIAANRFTVESFMGRNYVEQIHQDSISSMHADMLLSHLRPVPTPVETELGSAARRDA
jgi:hypothetical protein